MGVEEYAKIFQLFDSLGTSLIILVGIFFLIKKVLPDIVDGWKQKEIAQQEYYNARQKQYDIQNENQNKIMIGLNSALGEATAALNQSTAVIERNNAIITQQIALNEKMISSLDTLAKEEVKTVALLENHDKRAEKMNNDIIKMNGKIDTVLRVNNLHNIEGGE